MKSLRDQLVEAGLVAHGDAKAHERRQAELEYAAIKRSHSSVLKGHDNAVSLDALEAADSVSKFRRVVLNLLLEHPEMITEVVQRVHRLKEARGGKKLVWQMFQVRDGLANTPIGERERFLKRALRRAGGTFDQTAK